MDNPETYRGVPTISRNESAYKAPAPAKPHLAQVEVDDSTTTADYANVCRLSGTPEELLIDVGLNPLPTSTAAHPVLVTQRIVTGWYTAKRLLQVLQRTVQRHEAAFGVLETDVQKRVRRV